MNLPRKGRRLPNINLADLRSVRVVQMAADEAEFYSTDTICGLRIPPHLSPSDAFGQLPLREEILTSVVCGARLPPLSRPYPFAPTRESTSTVALKSSSNCIHNRESC